MGIVQVGLKEGENNLHLLMQNKRNVYIWLKLKKTQMEGTNGM